MKQLEKKLKELQKQGYEQVTATCMLRSVIETNNYQIKIQ